MSLTSPLSPSDTQNRVAVGELRAEWGWFVAFGVAFLLLGIVALLDTLAATVTSIFIVAALKIVAGVMQIAHALGAKTWGSVFLWLLAGVAFLVGAAASSASWRASGPRQTGSGDGLSSPVSSRCSPAWSSRSAGRSAASGRSAPSLPST